MIPVLFSIGPIPVHSFGLMLVCGFVAGWCLLYRELEYWGEDPALAERMVFWAGVGGLFGARLLYILSFPAELIRDPLGTIFGGAGFVFYGGFIGGAFAVWLFIRHYQLNFFRFGDLSAASLSIGYALGRVGCQLSGDGDYGAVSSLPWAMSYELGVVPTPPGVLVHPTPVYETIGALVIASLLVFLLRAGRLRREGQIFGLYLLLMAIARVLVEIIRIEPRVVGPLTQAQVEGFVIAAIGVWFLVRNSPIRRVAVSPRSQPASVPTSN